MKIAVSGGAGFIGRACVARIEEQGGEAVIFDRAYGSPAHHRPDVRDAFDVRHGLKGCDAVIHLAGVLGTAELFDEPYKAIDTNVKGTLNVLEVCKESGLRYVGISMPPVFPSIYTATKVCATRLASAYHHAYGVPVSHVRAFNAYGPGQAHGEGHPRKIIPAFAHEAWRNEPLTIWGDGTQTVDLVHTDDLARMLVDAVRWGDDCTFDGGTGTAWSVNTVADAVIQAIGTDGSVQYLPMRRGEHATNIVATGEGWERLGWQPIHSDYKFLEALDSYRDSALGKESVSA